MTVVESVSLCPLRHLLDDQFGRDFWEEVINRMVATTINSRDDAERKLSNCLAYLLARSKMRDPNADLVANLGPDEAWHIFMLYSKEYLAFCMEIAGTYLHHDPAGEAALVNRAAATAKTVDLFRCYGIPYDPELWQDHIVYPRGAQVIKSGFLVRDGTTRVD